MSARSARREAQRFLDQLRAETHAGAGTFPARIDPAVAKDVTNRFLRDSLITEQGQDPQMRALAERVTARGAQSVDVMFSKMLAEMQDDIEKTAAARIEGIDLGSRRPLIGHLQTGQLNAVSMRVPGRSGAYLVLFEDQMPLFATKLSKAVAWAVPHDPADANGMMNFKMSVRDVTERIETDPEVADRFADIIITYAVTGSLNQAGQHLMPPGYFNFAHQLCDSLEYFVLGHEYAHILLGHLETTAARKGVLSATEAEALAYSWQQELDADWLAWSCRSTRVSSTTAGHRRRLLGHLPVLRRTGRDGPRCRPAADRRRERPPARFSSALRPAQATSARLLAAAGRRRFRERREGGDGACAGRGSGRDHPPAVGTHPADPAGAAPAWRAGGAHVAHHPQGDWQ